MDDLEKLVQQLNPDDFAESGPDAVQPREFPRAVPQQPTPPTVSFSSRYSQDWEKPPDPTVPTSN